MSVKRIFQGRDEIRIRGSDEDLGRGGRGQSGWNLSSERRRRGHHRGREEKGEARRSGIALLVGWVHVQKDANDLSRVKGEQLTECDRERRSAEVKAAVRVLGFVLGVDP